VPMGGYRALLVFMGSIGSIGALLVSMESIGSMGLFWFL